MKTDKGQHRRRVLVPLAAAFDAWRAGTITSGALTVGEWVSIGISRMLA